MAASDQELDRYLGQLADEHPEEFGSAMRWLQENPERARPRLTALLRQGRDDFATRHALEVIGRIGRREDVPVLLERLSSASGTFAWDAARALALHPDAGARAALETAARSAELDVAKAAVAALGVRKDPAARASLEAALAHAHRDVRYRAVHSLVDIDAKPSKAALERCLKAESDPEVRGAAQKALGR